MITVNDWIEKLNLTPHPEGGYFSEVYRSDEIIGNEALPERYKSPRCFGTSIYFLLQSGQFSAFHQLQSDETWHFYYGIPIEIFIIKPDGELNIITLGSDILNGQIPQYSISKLSIFGAKPKGDAGFSVIGCSVYPGFDFADFKLCDRNELLNKFPEYEETINLLTR